MAMDRRAGLLACVAIAGLAQGCSRATNGTEWSGATPAPATMVVVENNNWMDMNVYLLRSGTRMRLGTVPSISNRRFALPAAAALTTSELRLEADPIGSPRTHVSAPIMFAPGDDIVWRIENHLPLSSFRTQPGGR